ncbi:MAG: hypothetical protein KDK37_07725 [Leptospiraceae bacterium]|nr:hypothetical protein [Leptospiraceae bacterium]MCB1304149.1 hypothetical protein [Leptospiraceae bacterium]
MKKTSLLIAAILTVSLAYCKGGSGPVSTAEALQDAACKGNHEEFMKYFDLDEFMNRTMDAALEARGLADNQAAKAQFEAMKPQILAQMEQKMQQEIANNKGGKDCDADIELVSEEGDTAKVRISLKDEEPRVVEMEKGEDGQWRVVFFDEITKKLKGE